jgi:NAD(P)-dependent dehydrogenase (short-subunit alcohol dehydrogenase family)
MTEAAKGANQRLLADKVAIVTGAGSGIGRAAALLFAAEGAKVCIAERDEVSGRAVASEIEAAGHEAFCHVTDVASEAQVERAVAATVARYGSLHAAFNNAGVEMANVLLPQLGLEDWHRLMNINLTGVFLCMKHQMRAMKGKGGAIVNMSSGDGIIGQPYAADYVSSKHGVIGLTRAASCEARHTGVRVNALMPGLIMTPMVEGLLENPAFESQFAPMAERHSIGRFGRPEDVAEAACWLLSDRSAFINGASLAVDGGYTAR